MGGILPDGSASLPTRVHRGTRDGRRASLEADHPAVDALEPSDDLPLLELLDAELPLVLLDGDDVSRE
jgi:hypothetical protein